MANYIGVSRENTGHLKLSLNIPYIDVRRTGSRLIYLPALFHTEFWNWPIIDTDFGQLYIIVSPETSKESHILNLSVISYSLLLNFLRTFKIEDSFCAICRLSFISLQPEIHYANCTRTKFHKTFP